jgi:hypothetical protein
METTELQQTATQEQLPRRKSALLFLLLGVIILGAIGAVAYLSRKGSGNIPQDLATIAPPESVVYVSLDLRPLLSQKKQFEPTIKAWEASGMVKFARTELEKQLTTEGISLKDDILSWAGPTLAFSLLDLPGMDMSGLSSGKPGPDQIPNFLVLATTRDAGKTKVALAKLMKKAGATGKTESYQGAELCRLEKEGLIYGIDGGLVLLGSKVETLKAALDRYHGKGRQLAQLESYKKVVAPLSHSAQERVVLYYVDFKTLQQLMGKNPLFSRANFSATEAKEMEALSGSVTITPEAVETESYGWGSKFAQSPTYKILSSLPPVGGRAFEFLPKDSIMASALPSPAAYWKLIQDALKQGAKQMPFDPIAEVKTGLKQATGLDLEQDILGWMTGELSLGVFGANTQMMMGGAPGAMPVQLSIIITGKDEATVTGKLALLRKGIETAILKEGGPQPTWQPEKTGAVSYQALVIPQIPITPCLGQVGKLAIISLTAEGFKQTVAAGLDANTSITTNATYQRVKSLLPRRPVSIFFAEPAPLAEQLSPLGAMSPYFKAAADTLKAFKSVIAGEELLPQGVHSIGRIEIDFPQLIKAADGLLPELTKAEGNAQNATCLSNVKAITLAMLMFADDHDGKLPKADRWVEDLMPYVKSAKLFKCSGDKSGERSSYAMNSALSGLSLSEVAHPESLVVVFEAEKPGQNPSGGPEAVLIVPRHNGNAYGFADGHAKVSPEVPNFDPSK